MVDDISKVIIDVAICSQDSENTSEFTPGKSSYKNFMNARQMHKGYHGMNAIDWQMRAYPDA